jgi:hypothetical protein
MAWFDTPVRMVTLAAVCLLSGCQAIFTFAPFASLQRNPESLPVEQQVEYARNALASGDAKTMKKAYDSLKGAQTVDALYVSAELAVELSGVPELVLGLAGLSGAQLYLSTGSLADLGANLATYDADPGLLVEAAGLFRSALALGQPLEPMDYLFGSVGLLLKAAEQPDGSFDYGSTSGQHFIDALPDAIAFLDLGIAALPSDAADDSLRVFFSTFSDYLNSL